MIHCIIVVHAVILCMSRLPTQISCCFNLRTTSLQLIISNKPPIFASLAKPPNVLNIRIVKQCVLTVNDVFGRPISP